jgi:hypothetical protein
MGVRANAQAAAIRVADPADKGVLSDLIFAILPEVFLGVNYVFAFPRTVGLASITSVSLQAE